MGHYTTGFGEQWKTYARTQLDSYTGRPISRDRLERCLGAPVETLKGQRVLEVGAGAGRFTELLLGAGAVLTSWTPRRPYTRTARIASTLVPTGSFAAMSTPRRSIPALSML
jgi:2-polyprenyl-3-methyl-5-hydroxy-6-metoxy-1,4-benzoquinol methylase